MTSIALRKDTWDRYILEEQKEYFKRIRTSRGDVWLDAGANIGCFACVLAPRVKQIVCYEPDEDNLKVLKANLESNGITNAIVVDKAIVGNSDTSRSFNTALVSNKGLHSFCDFLPPEHVKKTTVQTENIDYIIGRFGINKIMMDVEGAEQEILTSMKRWDAIREIMLEWHGKVLKDDDGAKRKELVGLLKKHFGILREKQNCGGDTYLIYGRRSSPPTAEKQA